MRTSLQKYVPMQTKLQACRKEAEENNKHRIWFLVNRSLATQIISPSCIKIQKSKFTDTVFEETTYAESVQGLQAWR